MSPGARSSQALILYYTRDYDRALAGGIARAAARSGISGHLFHSQARIHAARGALADAIGAANERAIAQAGRPPTGWRAHAIMLQAAGRAARRSARGAAPAQRATWRRGMSALDPDSSRTSKPRLATTMALCISSNWPRPSGIRISCGSPSIRGSIRCKVTAISAR